MAAGARAVSVAVTMYTKETDAAVGVPMIAPPAQKKCKHTQKVESFGREAQPTRNSRVPQTVRYEPASKLRLTGRIGTLEYVMSTFHHNMLLLVH